MGKKLIDLDKLEKLSKALDSRANAAIKAETQRALAAEKSLQTAINGKAASSHTHDDRYYTESEINTKVTNLQAEIDADVKVEADRAKAAEQDLQANIDKKANKSHGNHVPATQTASNKVFLRNDNTWATVTPANIGASATGHTHDDKYYTEAEIDAKITTLNNSINGKAPMSHSHGDLYYTEDEIDDKVADLQAEIDADVLTETNRAKGIENALDAAIKTKADSGHLHDGRYYTEAEVDEIVEGIQAEIDADVKVEADRAKGVENTLQANIDKKANSGHTHTNFAIKLNGGTTEGTNLFTYNCGTAKTVNITPSGIGASATGHTHDDRYFTETEINSKITTINNSIATAKSDAQKYADNKIAALVDSAPDAMNTLNELANAISDHQDVYDAYVQEVSSKLAGKSDIGHTHNYAGSSSAGGAATSANKVNANLAIKLNSGTTEGTNLFTFNGSAAKTVNITPSSIGAAASNHGPHVDYATATPKANGTAAVGASSKVAREDHVHPLQTTISGNAGSADKASKWTTARTLTIGNSGKSVDGSQNVSWSLSEIGAAPTSHDHDQLSGENLTGKTISLNDLNLSAGTPKFKVYFCPTDGGGSNITGRPDDNNKTAFNLIVESLRWSSTTDYITKQTYTQGAVKVVYIRYCTNGTWTSWEKVYTSVQKPTPDDIGAAKASHGTHVTWATATPKANGTAAIGSANRVAREDHVHPIQTTVSGNAGTASKWAAPITLTIGNKGKTVDGSGNVRWTLAEMGASENGHTHNYAGSSSAGGAANSVANSVKVQLNGGTTEGTNQFTFNGSAAKTINITPSSIGAAKESHGTHVTYASAAPLANGTAAVGSSSKVAREDHVHPLQTSVSGNAGTATKLKTARTITVNGIVSGSASFDGSDNVTITTTANDITSIEKSLTVGTDWMNTGISGSNLATGTYAVQMYADTQGTGGLWTEYFSGIMSWYSANTNSTEADEIALHKAGHASNEQHIYLRTKRNTNGVLVLQIAAKTAITTAIKFKFKFKKLI